ncbi:MAG: AAA family ATPase [Helicobacteraceae bacterium]|nr:AAA family ATPase [Helicobacteraceae bacterium]
MSTTLIGQIEKILFSDDSFFIAVLKNGEKVSGSYYESDVKNLVGSAVTLKGIYEEHKKYGKTFKFETLNVNQNELFFFLNKVIKGFTKKLSADLIEKFGQDGLIDVLDNDIEQLLEFKGIKEKRLKKIQESWKQFKSLRTLGEFLTPFGVTHKLLTTIATALKDVSDLKTKIKNNPYILTNIRGIGFKRADELALKMGIEPHSEKRISSAMEYLLVNQCEVEGNSAIERLKLFALLDDLLNAHDMYNLYEATLVERVSADEIVHLSHDRLSPRRIYEAEKFLYDEFTRRTTLFHDRIVTDLDKFIEENSFALGDQQAEAVKIINSGASLLFLVGYAGTGKSTTARAILELLTKRFERADVITCALSGIASQRIADTTGYESATIQSLLMKYEESKQVMPYKVVLIDEASMINSTLFARLISKVDRNAVIVVVGDDAQLPPIGSGNILSDVLSLELSHIIKLTKIYRQSEEQAIALIANDIREGKVPQYTEDYEDFEFRNISMNNYYAQKNSLPQNDLSLLREQNSNNILASIAECAIEYIPHARDLLKDKKIAEYLNYFQVIAPMKGGILGVDNLNKILQEYFNPKAQKVIKKGDKEFRLMDKVVHTKNENMDSYNSLEFKENLDPSKRRIFNGMSGLLFKIDEDEEQLFVFYPNEDLVVKYEYSEVKTHLMLSYALTIHKVQGMEYDVVVMPMSFSHFIMLNSKLLYTAITRAKNECYIIGEAAAFESACKRLEVTKRDTVMLELGSSK